MANVVRSLLWRARGSTNISSGHGLHALRALGGFGIIIFLSGVATGQPSSLHVAFRYDAERVLFYVDRFTDPVGQDYSHPLSTPLARYGGGGYLLPLTPERLKTFQTIDLSGANGPPSTRRKVPAIGSELVLRLGDVSAVSAVVERYVEQWGSENPIVNVGVLAKVASRNLTAFRAARSDYFLIDAEGGAAAPQRAQDHVRWNSTQIVNRFGSRGDLRVHVAEAGWCVTLHVPYRGELRPTGVTYCYGD